MDSFLKEDEKLEEEVEEREGKRKLLSESKKIKGSLMVRDTFRDIRLNSNWSGSSKILLDSRIGSSKVKFFKGGSKVKLINFIGFVK